MNDMTAVIMPKSDQINAETLLAGPMTITVSKVDIRPGTEQPVSIFFDGDNGKPYKPGKSMCRVMVLLWGPDANAYVGRSMSLYNDPKVLWGGMAVGGIRISHMSHIDGTQVMALTETKGKKKPFTVKPLETAAPPAKALTPAEWLNALEKDLILHHGDEEMINGTLARTDVQEAQAKAKGQMLARLNAMIQSALDSIRVSAEDEEMGAAHEPEEAEE